MICVSIYTLNLNEIHDKCSINADINDMQIVLYIFSININNAEHIIILKNSETCMQGNLCDKKKRVLHIRGKYGVVQHR